MPSRPRSAVRVSQLVLEGLFRPFTRVVREGVSDPLRDARYGFVKDASVGRHGFARVNDLRLTPVGELRLSTRCVSNCVSNCYCEVFYQEREEDMYLLRDRRIVCDSIVLGRLQRFIGAFIRSIVPRGLHSGWFPIREERNCFGKRLWDVKVVSHVKAKVSNYQRVVGTYLFRPLYQGT